MSDFLSFAHGYGLIIESPIADDRWHRCRTEDKPRKKNGAYVFDGNRGVVINFATMVHGESWRSGVRTGHVDRAAIRAQHAIGEAQKRAKQVEARAVADGMMKRATLGPHPYLKAKGFPEESGLVLDGELLIPMREFAMYRQVNSLQRIAEDGTKLFLPGGKAKGSVYFIGPFMAQTRWLVEGYATGLSMRAALRSMYIDAQVVVCFSAGNLAHIGRLAAALSVPAYAMADNDKSGAGAQAAEETGLPWRMPPIQDFDANDYHRELGLPALSALIRDAHAVRRTVGAA